MGPGAAEGAGSAAGAGAGAVGAASAGQSPVVAGAGSEAGAGPHAGATAAGRPGALHGERGIAFMPISMGLCRARGGSPGTGVGLHQILHVGGGVRSENSGKATPHTARASVGMAGARIGNVLLPCRSSAGARSTVWRWMTRHMHVCLEAWHLRESAGTPGLHVGHCWCAHALLLLFLLLLLQARCTAQCRTRTTTSAPHASTPTPRVRGRPGQVEEGMQGAGLWWLGGTEEGMLVPRRGVRMHRAEGCRAACDAVSTIPLRLVTDAWRHAAGCVVEVAGRFRSLCCAELLAACWLSVTHIVLSVLRRPDAGRRESQDLHRVRPPLPHALHLRMAGAEGHVPHVREPHAGARHVRADTWLPYGGGRQGSPFWDVPCALRCRHPAAHRCKASYGIWVRWVRQKGGVLGWKGCTAACGEGGRAPCEGAAKLWLRGLVSLVRQCALADRWAGYASCSGGRYGLMATQGWQKAGLGGGAECARLLRLGEGRMPG